jgi:hypothetical protein
VSPRADFESTTVPPPVQSLGPIRNPQSRKFIRLETLTQPRAREGCGPDYRVGKTFAPRRFRVYFSVIVTDV